MNNNWTLFINSQNQLYNMNKALQIKIYFILTLLAVIIGPKTMFSQTTLLSPTVNNGGFESGTTGWSFAAAGAAQGAWAIGTATAFAGTQSAYVSNDGGTSNLYTGTATRVQHIYRSLNFPAGEPTITLSFKWKCNGEGSASDWDNIKVFVSTTAPTGGTANAGASQVGSTWYNLQTTWQTVTITLPSSLAGTTSNLIFQWKTDGSGAFQPPGAIDDITVTTSTVVPPAGCTSNTTLYPSTTFTPSCTGSFQNITTAGYATEYSMVYLTAGTTYTFTSSISTDYLTIANGAGGTPIYAAGTTPVVYTATVTGAVRMYDNTNSSCGTNTTIRTRAVGCGTVAGGPGNDDPTGATTLTIGSSCTYTTYTNAGATASTCGTIPAPGCASYSGGDVWFAVTVPAGGAIDIDTQTGVMTDGGMAVYSGTPCGVLTLLACDDDGSANGLMPTISMFGQTPGDVLYIRVWEYGNNNNGTFGICVTEPPPTGPCGNPTNNDYCSDPATLTQGAGTFSSTTSSTFSADTPGGVGAIFCGSVENNSWYRFTASATTQTFNFSTVSGCTSGIQAQVYSITTSSVGCCTGFTAKSNCFNPGIATTGVVTATALTVGQPYVLMVDGYGGDVCDFVVSGWTATGILPIQLISFTGKNDGERNILTWLTASEKNNDYFTLEHSQDGINFEKVNDTKGAGNSSSTLTYYGYDTNPYEDITYYRLKQTDFDGKFEYSHLVSINVSDYKNQLSNIHPNPTNASVNFDVYSNKNDNALIQVISFTGKTLIEKLQSLEKGNNSLDINLDNMKNGVYLLKVTFEKSGDTFINKVIKN